MKRAIKTLLLILVLFLPCASFASWSVVQSCTAITSTFFSTNTVSCTLSSSVGANHLIIVGGYSCTNTCYATGVQATHSISDSLGLTYTNVLNTAFASPRRGGNIAQESIFYAETGATTGSDTVTLTLNAAAGNGIFVMEVSGLATSIPVVGSNATLGSYPGGGSAPITYTGGTITIGGVGNTATVLGHNSSASDWIISFVAFQAISGNDLLLVYGDCENCATVNIDIPPGYTLAGSATDDGAGNDVFLVTSASLGVGVRHRSQIY